jgi:hypothetical protein
MNPFPIGAPGHFRENKVERPNFNLDFIKIIKRVVF